MASTPNEQRYRLLSVIVPVYNERNTVVEQIRRIRAVDLPLALEIIVVNDGSTDGTDKVLAALEDSTVRVLKHPVNRGKGAAIRTGLQKANGDLVLIQDADLEYDPDDWPRLLEPALKGKTQVVFGTRFRGERMNMRLASWIGNRTLVFVTNVLYGTTLSDMETCSKLVDRKLLDELQLESDRFDVEPEITAKLLSRGVPIYEVPISYSGREVPEGRKFQWADGVRALGTLIRYRMRGH
ncbi:MAG: glycosyltransferase family 2 protein [Acidimicrobiales bacterium]